MLPLALCWPKVENESFPRDLFYWMCVGSIMLTIEELPTLTLVSELLLLWYFCFCGTLLVSSCLRCFGSFAFEILLVTAEAWWYNFDFNR